MLSNLLAVARRPFAAIIRHANSPLYQPFSDQPTDHPSRPVFVAQPQARTARIIPFPAPSAASFPDKSVAPTNPRSISITNILGYTGPFSSSASRAAIPRLWLGSLR